MSLGPPSLRVAFAGTPEFAAVALEAIHAAGHELTLVLSQPDRPAGRGLKLAPSAVKRAALDKGTRVIQPAGLKLDGKFASDARAAREAIGAARPDVIVVAAYGLILPAWVLEAAPLGCLNIHGSLLPRWRGAAPIHRAIEAGDAQTGITVMQMDQGLDTGPMLLSEAVSISADDTTGSLHDTLAALGGKLIVRALGLAAQGGLKPVPQPDEGVTYAHKIAKSEAAIDWSLDAAVIERRLRAFDPFPGASAEIAGETIKCWRGIVVTPDEPAPTPGAASAPSRDPPPGTVLEAGAAGLVVACGHGSSLRLTQLQRPGGKRVSAAQFVLASPLR